MSTDQISMDFYPVDFNDDVADVLMIFEESVWGDSQIEFEFALRVDWHPDEGVLYFQNSPRKAGFLEWEDDPSEDPDLVEWLESRIYDAATQVANDLEDDDEEARADAIREMFDVM